jgi:hypothetical protein
MIDIDRIASEEVHGAMQIFMNSHPKQKQI